MYIHSDIPPKYNGIGAKQPVPQQEGNAFKRLSAKLKFEREVIEPVLGELTYLYRHHCTLFISGEYVGQGYGSYRQNDNDRYSEVGELLKTI
ncbi:MAG: hypothetical protein VKL42_08825 [Snowella sp.]|nr:hypothetical protein [Snowella sp.]